MREAERNVRPLASRDDLLRTQCIGTSECRGLEAIATEAVTSTGPDGRADCGWWLDKVIALP